jgi:hypothetical protein
MIKKPLYIDYEDTEQLLHGLFSFTKNSKSSELIDKLNKMQEQMEKEEESE